MGSELIPSRGVGGRRVRSRSCEDMLSLEPFPLASETGTAGGCSQGGRGA